MTREKTVEDETDDARGGGRPFDGSEGVLISGARQPFPIDIHHIGWAGQHRVRTEIRRIDGVGP